MPAPTTRDRALSRYDELLTPPFDEGLLTLRDGRLLSYAQFGDPRGFTVLWFHGTPGARLQLPPEAAAFSAAHAVRLVGIDRPGVGKSTPHRERTLLTWACDIAELADWLGADRFAVAGLSGGGPHALAVAHELGERVVAGAVLGGMAPIAGAEAPTGVPSYVPRLLEHVHALRGPLGDVMTGLMRNLPVAAADSVFPWILRAIPEVDRVVVAEPRVRAMFLRDIVGGSQDSFRAQIHDIATLGRDWGFSLRKVRVPIRLWHGSADQLVPLAHAQHMLRLLPNAELTVHEGEGHFAGFARPQTVLAWLRSFAPTSPT